MDNVINKTFFGGQTPTDINEEETKNKNKTEYINKGWYCNNCGKKNHDYKDCKEPIISLGVILVKLEEKTEELMEYFKKNTINMNIVEGINITNLEDIKNFSRMNQNKIEFLMIQRKNTLGYIEFIRGRYNLENLDGISSLFQQMTQEEIDRIGTESFENLWNNFWGETEKKQYLEIEYNKSQNKFNNLKKGESELDLNFFVKNIKPQYKESEWGFPKGRRNKQEENLECAKREFEEETGLNKNDYEILEKLEPLVEDFTGTNGVRYKHIYYIAISKNNKIPSINEENKNQIGEVGDIKYINLENCLRVIRPYHIARKKIITKLYSIIMEGLITTMKHK